MHPNAAFVGGSARAIQAIFAMHKDVARVLDPTYGLGGFYKLTPQLQVTGGDLNPAKGIPMDIRALPFKDESFDAVVLDPPYMSSSGSALEHQFGMFGQSQEKLIELYIAGLQEAWRVARVLVVAKCADAVNSGKFVPVAARVITGFGQPLYDTVITVRERSMEHPHWRTVKHFRHNYAYYLIWRKD